MCLAHTTGFANWRFFESDKKLRVNSIPGTKYGYSGEKVSFTCRLYWKNSREEGWKNLPKKLFLNRYK